MQPDKQKLIGGQPRTQPDMQSVPNLGSEHLMLIPGVEGVAQGIGDRLVVYVSKTGLEPIIAKSLKNKGKSFEIRPTGPIKALKSSLP